MISRIRQRWAQSAPDRFVTLQPLPSSLTRALDSASPNPCSASTGFSSDPVAPVSCQVAPLQVAIHPSWPSPSGGAVRVPVPRALPALPLPPAPAPACRWRDGSSAPKYRPSAALQCGPYAPVSGPSRPPYRPPLLLEDPVAPPAVRPSFSSALLGPPAFSPAGPVLVGHRPPSLTTAPGPTPTFLSVGSPHSVSDSMATLTGKAKLCLADQWADILSQLGSASVLFQEASATRDPNLRHPVLRFAPSTLQRYLADWISWHTFCLAVSADPSNPPPGTLPDWLSVRASKQGPSRALCWMARVAGLPCLQARLQLSIVRAFATATAPSERRESLPLPLSFVIWLERRVADPSAPPSEALFLGFLLIAVWASLRWGDLLWIPPDRLHLQLAHLAVLGTALRTKTTARSMPFGFLITGVSGSPSCNWGMRFLNLLRQALSDTQSRQPGRVIDFLPACLGGSDPRPFILEPCPRRLAVPGTGA